MSFASKIKSALSSKIARGAEIASIATTLAYVAASPKIDPDNTVGMAAAAATGLVAGSAITYGSNKLAGTNGSVLMNGARSAAGAVLAYRAAAAMNIGVGVGAAVVADTIGDVAIDAVEMVV